mmetsp:Transcript_14789/g.41878  ORF Transcript_14789/g.41878 Transcript_14789/m.41878 type:complete len:257 (+) Transcript_14789:136-906(+)
MPGSSQQKLKFYLQFLPALLGGIAIVIGTAANLHCQTVSISQLDDDGKIYSGVFHFTTKNFDEVYKRQAWCPTDCESYNNFKDDTGFDFDVNAFWRTTKAFAVIGPIVGGIALFGAVIVPCFQSAFSGRKKWMWFATVLGLAFAGVCQGLTLLILKSSVCENNPILEYLEDGKPDLRTTFADEPECQWEAGLRMGIAATVFWCLAAIYGILRPANTKFPPRPVQTQTITYKRNADGTVTKTSVDIQYHHDRDPLKK